MTLSELYRRVKTVLGGKRLGTGEGQIFKDGIKAVAFEVYRGISVLHLEQLKDDKIVYKYLYYTTEDDGAKRTDTLHSGEATSLERSKDMAMAEIDKIVN